MKACGLDPAPLDLLKAGYSPNQPPVPGGNPDGGQWTSDDAPAISRPDHVAPTPVRPINYTSVQGLPAGAKIVIPPDGIPIPDKDSPTKKLMAPSYTDFRQIYAAGQAIASLPLLDQYSRVRAAIGQEGAYDLQRDVPNKKILSRLHTSGELRGWVYMAGAGYSIDTTRALAKLYALRHSSNYDTQDQLNWIGRGWTDAKSGRWR